MGVVGGYLLYTAYELFKGRGDPDTTMQPVVIILFIVLFAAAGVALLVYAWRLWKRGAMEEKQQKPEDKNGLKS